MVGGVLAVGDVKNRYGFVVLNAFEKIVHLKPRRVIEGAEWLVEQQNLRSKRKGPSEGDALSLTAAETLRATAQKVLYAEKFGHLFDALCNLSSRPVS